jgi:hypothetical protein
MADSKRPAAPTNRELLALVRAAPRTPGRVTALSELVERGPRGINSTLTELALDPELDQSVRVDAVSTLGREATASAINGLTAALDADDPVVVRRAIERLGKVGGIKELELLQGVRTGNVVTERVMRTAQCFLSYRHRLDTYRVDQPKQRLAATGDAVELPNGAPTPTMRRRLELAGLPAPGFALGDEPVRRLECGWREFALMPDEAVLADGAASLTEQQAIPAVLTQYDIETGRFEPAYYFFTDPVGEDTFRVMGLRGSGRAALAGSGVVSDTSIEFEVNATEMPIDHPLTVRGTYDVASRAVRFDVALSDPRFSPVQQRLRRQPRLDV